MSDNGTSTHFRTCPLCEATCGLEITMRGESVVRVRGDRDDVFSHGFICPKGSTVRQLHEDPDRLRGPLVKRDDEWQETSWAEAYQEVERRLVPLLDEHGRDTVAVYLGNPTVHNHGATLYGRPLIKALGTRNIYSAATVDQMPKHVSTGLMFGNPLLIPVPDLDRTDYLLMLGANPWQSNGSLCTAPDFPGRLKAIQDRGGRFVVVDPRRSRTAQEADEHVFIRPGTDVLFLLALAHELFATGRVDLGAVSEICDGLAEVEAAVQPFDADTTAAATGIEATTTRRIAAELAAAERGAVYGRIGTSTVTFGTVASWAVDVLCALTGNLDRAGGAMFPYPAHSNPLDGTPGGRGFTVGRHHSRVKGFPEVRGEFPVATLPDEIETPGEGQVRALITVAGNPVLSNPDAQRLDRALAGLDLMVSIDPYLNETTRHADVILPPASALEKSHYDLAFYGLAVRNVANYSPALVETEQPDETDILARLSLIAAGQGADGDPAMVHELVLATMLQRAVSTSGSPLEGRDPDDLRAELAERSPADQVLDVMLRAGPYGDQFGAVPDGLSLERLEAEPHGVDLGPLTPMLPGALRTPTGRVELAPRPILEDLARLDPTGRDLVPEGDGLVLVGRRHVRSNNSWMHNVKVLVKGRDRCTLQVHPDDAARFGLDDGGSARIASRVGAVDAPVEVTSDVMPGVVSLPHGWGHDLPGARLAVAKEHAGVNSNILTDGSVVDALSGNAVLNGIPVEVTPTPG